MVSFTCENCGDILKEDIAQHVRECKGPFPLTCIHCKEEFYDDQYILHTSCALEVPDVPEEHAKPESVEIDKPEIIPSGKAATQSDWLCAISRASQSPSLTPQQSTLLAALANLHNVPKHRPSFRKFARCHWKEADAHENVVEEVFLLIKEQALNELLYWPNTQGQEPAWLAAMRAAKQVPSLTPLQNEIFDKVFNYQKSNPVPLSLSNKQSLQNLIREVFKGSSLDHQQMVNALFGTILSAISDVNGLDKAPGAKETAANSTKDSAEDVASKIKKKVQKLTEYVAEMPEVVAKKAVEEDTSKKSKKKKHRRQEDAVDGVDVPRKKSMKSA